MKEIPWMRLLQKVPLKDLYRVLYSWRTTNVVAKNIQYIELNAELWVPKLTSPLAHHLVSRLLHDKLCDVGTATFIGVFQQYSTSKMFFPVFKDSPLEDLTLNEALQNHGLRVMRVRKLAGPNSARVGFQQFVNLSCLVRFSNVWWDYWEQSRPK